MASKRKTQDLLKVILEAPVVEAKIAACMRLLDSGIHLLRDCVRDPGLVFEAYTHCEALMLHLLGLSSHTDAGVRTAASCGLHTLVLEVVQALIAIRKQYKNDLKADELSGPLPRGSAESSPLPVDPSPACAISASKQRILSAVVPGNGAARGTAGSPGSVGMDGGSVRAKPAAGAVASPAIDLSATQAERPFTIFEPIDSTDNRAFAGIFMGLVTPLSEEATQTLQSTTRTVPNGLALTVEGLVSCFGIDDAVDSNMIASKGDSAVHDSESAVTSTETAVTQPHRSMNALLSFADLDIHRLLHSGKHLLAYDTVENYKTTHALEVSDIDAARAHILKQRQHVRRILGDETAGTFDSRDSGLGAFVRSTASADGVEDVDLLAPATLWSQGENLPVSVYTSLPAAIATPSGCEVHPLSRVLHKWYSDMCHQMFAPAWEARQCAATTLLKVVRSCSIDDNGGLHGLSSQTSQILIDCCVRCMAILLLDKVGDYTGESVLAPVRTVTAELLGTVLGLLQKVNGAHNALAAIPPLMDNEDWHIRHGAAETLVRFFCVCRRHGVDAKTFAELQPECIRIVYKRLEVEVNDDVTASFLALLEENLAVGQDPASSVDLHGHLSRCLELLMGRTRGSISSLLTSSVLQFAANVAHRMPSCGTLQTYEMIMVLITEASHSAASVAIQHVISLHCSLLRWRQNYTNARASSGSKRARQDIPSWWVQICIPSMITSLFRLLLLAMPDAMPGSTARQKDMAILKQILHFIGELKSSIGVDEAVHMERSILRWRFLQMAIDACGTHDGDIIPANLVPCANLVKVTQDVHDAATCAWDAVLADATHGSDIVVTMTSSKRLQAGEFIASILALMVATQAAWWSVMDWLWQHAQNGCTAASSATMSLVCMDSFFKLCDPPFLAPLAVRESIISRYPLQLIIESWRHRSIDHLEFISTYSEVKASATQLWAALQPLLDLIHASQHRQPSVRSIVLPEGVRTLPSSGGLAGIIANAKAVLQASKQVRGLNCLPSTSCEDLLVAELKVTEKLDHHVMNSIALNGRLLAHVAQVGASARRCAHARLALTPIVQCLVEHLVAERRFTYQERSAIALATVVASEGEKGSKLSVRIVESLCRLADGQLEAYRGLLIFLLSVSRQMGYTALQHVDAPEEGSHIVQLFSYVAMSGSGCWCSNMTGAVEACIRGLCSSHFAVVQAAWLLCRALLADENATPLFLQHICTSLLHPLSCLPMTERETANVDHHALRLGALRLAQRITDQASHGSDNTLLLLALLMPTIIQHLHDDDEELRSCASAALESATFYIPLLTDKSLTHCVLHESVKEAVHTGVRTAEAFTYGISTGLGKLPAHLSSRVGRGCHDTAAVIDVSALKVRLQVTGFSGRMRDYQLLGVHWLEFLRSSRLNGILADDMGLGKTIQALSAIALYARDHQKDERWPQMSVIVCPVSLLCHWQHQIRMHFALDTFSCEVYDGRRPSPPLGGVGHHLILATYTNLRRRSAIMEENYAYAILDEGHLMRNPETEMARACCELGAKSLHRIVLTGTPIHNDVSDIWSLFRFLMPRLLPEWSEFCRVYRNVVARALRTTATKCEVERADGALVSLHAKLLPYILRRTKSDVIQELPPKVSQELLCDLAPVQKAIYDAIATSQLPALSISRQLQLAASHPWLVGASSENPIISGDFIRESGKLHLLASLLDKLGFVRYENDMQVSIPAPSRAFKALIFTQLPKSAELLQQVLRGLGCTKLWLLRSSTSSVVRQETIDAFSEATENAILLSTVAIGGLGFNIAAANIVILFELSWNPMEDLQAVDRAHRIGQSRAVYVYQLVTRNTIEQRILETQRFKAQVAEKVVCADGTSADGCEEVILREVT